MENKDFMELEPLAEEDVKVQTCDPSKCGFDCPPYAPNQCGSLLTPKK